jgi:serine/threonine-protein kinase
LSRQINVGDVLGGRYELLALLGRGGMGLVFKALDRRMSEVVALKVLLPGGDLSTEMRRRFRDEAKLARKVAHRNVCRVFHYDEDEDVPFIVMEYVEGLDLKRSLQKVGSMEWEDGFDVSLQVAEGLGAIHDMGIVHRDLKPANITRDTKGIVKVMDFGIAKGGTQPGITDDGKLVCTIDYVSPEQIMGDDVDPRSDLYSFGIVIYELFTGRVPFRGDTPAATMHKHVHEPPPLYGLAATLIPESLVPVLEVALTKNRTRRFTKVEEMRDALVRARDEMRKRGTSPVVPPNGSGQASGLRRPFAGPYPPEALLLVPALVRALASADRGTRLGAAEALARTPDASARPALEAALEDAERVVWEAAKGALLRLDAPPPPRDDEPTPGLPYARSSSSAAPTPTPGQSDVGSSSVKESLRETSDIDVRLDPASGHAVPEPEPGPRPVAPPDLPAPPPPPKPPPKPAPKPAPKPPHRLLVIALVMIALAIISAMVMRTYREPPHAPPLAPPTATPEVTPTGGVAAPVTSQPTAMPPTAAPEPVVASVPKATASRPRPTTTTTLPPPPTTLATPVPTPTPEPPPTTAAPTAPPPTPDPTPAPPQPGALVEASDPGLLRPVCAVCPPPKLPLIAEDPRYLPQLHKTGGRVELRVLVDEAGRVVDVAPLAGEKALSDAAVKAVRTWKYAPGTKQGVKVKVWLLVPLQFELPPLR